MIHFFVTFSDDATNSPFAHALRDQGVPHRLFSGKVLLRYQRRIWLLLVGLPRLLRFALRSAWRSLVRATPRPDAVVLGSHLEALVFALSAWLLRRHTRVYLLGFIFTRRSNPWLDALRRRYFGRLFRALDGILCHSRLEAGRYDELFPGAKGKFVFVPYGLHIHGHDHTAAVVDPATAPALSAGRSGRDYALLTRVFAANGRPLHIVCDSARALEGCAQAPNITVLRHCYDADYVAQLRAAGMVIVPLAVDDISAGQMVVIQAMAYRKPIIATRTATLDDYLQEGDGALLVPPGDAKALHAAVERLATDPGLAARLAEESYRTYVERHSMRAFVKHVVGALAALEPKAPAGRDAGALSPRP